MADKKHTSHVVCITDSKGTTNTKSTIRPRPPIPAYLQADADKKDDAEADKPPTAGAAMGFWHPLLITMQFISMGLAFSASIIALIYGNGVFSLWMGIRTTKIAGDSWPDLLYIDMENEAMKILSDTFPTLFVAAGLALGASVLGALNMYLFSVFVLPADLLGYHFPMHDFLRNMFKGDISEVDVAAPAAPAGATAASKDEPAIPADAMAVPTEAAPEAAADEGTMMEGTDYEATYAEGTDYDATYATEF